MLELSVSDNQYTYKQIFPWILRKESTIPHWRIGLLVNSIIKTTHHIWLAVHSGKIRKVIVEIIQSYNSEKKVTKIPRQP